MQRHPGVRHGLSLVFVLTVTAGWQPSLTPLTCFSGSQTRLVMTASCSLAPSQQDQLAAGLEVTAIRWSLQWQQDLWTDTPNENVLMSLRYISHALSQRAHSPLNSWVIRWTFCLSHLKPTSQVSSQPAEQFGKSVTLPIGARGDTWHALLPCGKLQC